MRPLIFRHLALYLGMIWASLGSAQTKGNVNVDQYIQFGSAVVPDYAAQSNAIKQDGLNQVRKQLPHQTASIPKSWRLVNVISKTKVGTTQNDYLMFFQDEKTKFVYTLNIDESGFINPQTSIKIPAYPN